MSRIAVRGAETGSGVFTIQSPTTNTDRTLTLPDVDGSVVTANASGNVGIGTSSPESFGGGHKTLELSGSTNTEGGVFKTATSGSAGSGSTGTEMLVFTDSVGGKINVISAHPAVFYTANTERMRIDSAGRVTMLHQPHIFGSVTNTTGTGVANSFTTAFSQGGLTFVTDRITVPVAGLYAISFNSLCLTSTGRVDSSVRINGTAILRQLSEDNGTGFHYRSASTVVKLQASDYIQFQNDSWYNATVTVFDEWRTASVTLIG